MGRPGELRTGSSRLVTAPERGEVWWCEHPDIGRRPVVVMSRDAAIRGRGLALVAPCSTRRRGLPSEVELHAPEHPVPRDCVVSLDSVEQVPTGLLVERLGRLDPMTMRVVCRALAVAVDCE